MAEPTSTLTASGEQPIGGLTPLGKIAAQRMWDYVKRESPALELMTGTRGSITEFLEASANVNKAMIGGTKEEMQTASAELAEKLPEFMPVGMVAWHGSPHKFLPTKKSPLGEFDLSKMGSGEGAQAYGWGTYLAEGKGTAKFYKEALSEGPISATYKGKDLTAATTGQLDQETVAAQKVAGWMAKTGFTPDEALQKATEVMKRQLKESAEGMKAQPELKFHEFANKEAKELIPVLEKMKAKDFNFETPGHLYEVDLPDKEIDKMLDWDKPISDELSSKLQGGIIDNQNLGKVWKETVDGEVITRNPKGSEVYGMLQAELGQEQASKALNELGIPGIKYYDATSRTAGEGTRNFVVFDPKKAKIVGRNGERIAEEAGEAFSDVKQISSKWKDKGVKLSLYENPTTIDLNSIVVPKEMRKQGMGSDVIEEIISYADKSGKRIELTPDIIEGAGATSKKRLTEFYKRFGFKENKGKARDFTTRAGMIREPMGNK